MSARVIFSGKKFNHWTVIEYRSKASLCRCDCGTESIVDNNNLRGGSRSCRKCSLLNNTYARKGNKQIPRALYRHLATVVSNAFGRCKDPNNSAYAGRGIKVVQEWVNDPGLFINYLATLPGAEDRSLVLDRIDNDGNYEPGNLRFATHQVSGLNRRAFAHKLLRNSKGRFARKEGVFCSQIL